MNLETCTPAQASLSPAIASITAVFHNWPLLELFLISGVEVRWGEEMQGWCVRQLEQNGLSLAVSSAQPQPIAAERGQGAETLDVKSRKRAEQVEPADVFALLAAPEPALQHQPAGLVLR